MPTTNAVPSADPSDLLFNAQKLDEVINGSAESFFDRRGVERLTLTGALRLIGFEAPVAFTTGLSITRSTQTVTNSGNTYHADPASLPFTTTGTFNGAQWRLVSNVTQADLTTYAIPRTGATDLTASFKTTGTWEATGFKLDANALWSLVSSNPTWQADSGDALSYNRTSNTWSWSIGGTERFYLTAADGPARGADASTDNGLPRKLQVATMISDALVGRMRVTLTANQTATGLSVDFTGIPSWAKRLTISFIELSTTGTFNPVVQLGAGTYKTTGYAGSQTLLTSGVAVGNLSTGFALGGASAGAIRNGDFVLTLVGANVWQANGGAGFSDSAGVSECRGYVAMPSEPDMIRMFFGGTDVADGGTVSLLIEG